MKTWLVAIILFLVMGCETGIPLNVFMTNPETGKTVHIHHVGTGFWAIGTIANLEAEKKQAEAIEEAKAKGYTVMRVVK